MQENRQGEAPGSYIASRLVYAVRGEGAAFDREAKLFVQGRHVPVRSLCLDSVVSQAAGPQIPSHFSQHRATQSRDGWLARMQQRRIDTLRRS